MRTPPRPVDAAAVPGPRERKGDTAGVVESPRISDRRAAGGCLWDACEALLSSHADPEAPGRALQRLMRAFDCAGVALHVVGRKGDLEPWCARGDWEQAPGDLRECMGVPLLRGRTRVGALDLRARRGQRWTHEQQTLVRTASGALGAALGTRLELDQLRREPGRDPVTGLADTKGFHLRLLEEIGRAERTGAPLALVLIGLDHFGALNSRYGRPAGDAVLAETASVLKLALREGDALARLPGDVFGVLLPDCDVAPARRLCERLRRAVEHHHYPRAGQLTASAGVAGFPRTAVEGPELLQAAERALALAKKAGRRRTATSESPGLH